MQLSKRSALALVIAVFFACVEARDGSFLRTLSQDKTCYEPIEGPWKIENRYPSLPGSDELQLDGIATLMLTKPAENIYNGTGTLESIFPVQASGIPVQLAAIFDPETCTLSGSLASSALDAALLFRWESIGSQAFGPYIAKLNGTLMNAVFGYHNASYIS